MKVVFKLAIDESTESVENVEIVKLRHQIRMLDGLSGHFPFNQNQNVVLVWEDDGLLIEIEGERCALTADGVVGDVIKLVKDLFGADHVQLLAQATHLLNISRGPIKCIEYTTSDSRLEWNETLADWMINNPNSTQARELYWSAVTNGHIHCDKHFPFGLLNEGKYTATQRAAINGVLATLNPKEWSKRADALKAFKAGRKALLEAF